MSFGGGVSGGGGSISSASDVFISSVADGEVLQYNNSTAKWNNLSLAERVQDIVGASLVAGSNITVNYNDAAGTITLAATGGGAGDPTMGGDLNGTASNAQIAAGAVGPTELATNAVTTVKIADSNVTTAKINDGAITEPKLAASNAPASGQLLGWDGTNLTWASAGSTPTYANLPAGTTLTVVKSGGTWPARPTSRTDIVVQWKGADPSPAIVPSGTGGMLDNVDIRFITP